MRNIGGQAVRMLKARPDSGHYHYSLPHPLPPPSTDPTPPARPTLSFEFKWPALGPHYTEQTNMTDKDTSSLYFVSICQYCTDRILIE